MRPVASFPHLAEPSEAGDSPGLDTPVQSFLLGGCGCFYLLNRHRALEDILTGYSS